MEITIQGPTFYASQDEELFFSCIYQLPGYQGVVGQGTDLQISFADPLSEETVMRLLVILRRWGVDIGPLKGYESRTKSKTTLWTRSLL